MKRKWTLCLCFLSFLQFTISKATTASSLDAPVDNGSSFSVNSNLVSLEDTLYRQISNCTDSVFVCMDIPLSDISNFQILHNGQPYSRGLDQCDRDTFTFYSYADLEGQGASGPYVLQSWIFNGDIYTTPFTTLNELIDSMNVWDPTGNWTDDPANNRILGGDNANTYSVSMVVWVPSIGEPDLLTLDEFYISQGSLLNFGEGMSEVIINESATACSDTFYVEVRCIRPQTFRYTLELSESGQDCLDFSELGADVNSVNNFCENISDPLVSFAMTNGDSCVSFTALSVGVDSACIAYCDQLGYCDTSYFVVTVRNPRRLFVRDLSLAVSARDTICVDTTTFDNPLDTIFDLCSGSNGIFAGVEIDTVNYCVYLEGLAFRGVDTACIVFCDTLNECDTLQLQIDVFRDFPVVRRDTLIVNKRDTFCDFDTSNLNAPLLMLDNFCDANSGEFIDFTVDNASLCVNYQAIDVGTDTACILLRDQLGGLDTTYLIITAELPQTEVITDTVRMGLTIDFCVDTTELCGDLLDTLFLCAPFNGNAMTLSLDSTTYCAQIEGTGSGTDTICLVICDDLAVCDTTILRITIDDFSMPAPPEAMSDFDTTTQNIPITINVLGNDLIPNDFWTQFFILPVGSGGIGPNNGTTIGNPADGTIQYIPDADFCGDFDNFSYVVCNDDGCDTSTVTIFVDCPSTEFVIRNGFSPNGDSRNDSFVIEGIEGFPDHTLYIYNRWGNLVLETQNYQNDWQGTWDGGDLPDGVYFYVFDDGNGNSLSGYVMLQR
ncbi:MAG: gliding motility-associated C-terminal domain-containing protein [Bacteroidota bacterium]